MKHRNLLLASLLALLPSLLVWPRLARAEGPAPLQLLPAERLRALAPLLRTTDMTLIESDAQGALKQITVMSFAAAPPAAVRDAVIHPERYGDFVRNMKKSTIVRRPDGTLDHTYQLSYTILTIDGVHRYVFLPPTGAPGEGAAPVEFFDADPSSNGLRHYRWEFLSAGGGTVVVLYGYADVRHSGGVVDQLLQRVPSLEHGLALVGQMSLVLSMKARAEQLAPAPAASLVPPGAVSYDFLLSRGLVTLLRSQRGRLSDLSMVERTRARPDLLMQVTQKPALWSNFVPSITRSADAGSQQGVPAVELEQALPLLSFRTVYGLQAGDASLDMFGLSGDLRGARLRWDVRVDRDGKGQLVLRASQAYDRASMVIRQLYRLEPLFEYGVNVGLCMVIQQGIKARAEQMMAAGAQAERAAKPSRGG